MSFLASMMEPILNNLTMALIFLVVFILLLKYLQPSPYNLPPMPGWNIPIIGHLGYISMSTLGEKMFIEASKELKSSIVAVKFGSQYFVILHKFEEMKEAFASEEFINRGKNLIGGIMLNSGLLNDGQRWKAQRRFALHALRDLGLGKSRIEGKIQLEAQELVNLIASLDGEPTETVMSLNIAVSNIICTMVFGHRFEYEDKLFKRLIQIFNENTIDHIRPVFLAKFLPFLKYLPGDLTHEKRLKQNVEEIKTHIIKPEIKRHIERYDPDNINDFIDAFIKEMRNQKDTAEEDYFNDEQLMWNIEDLFFAWTDTTSTTLRWLLLCMIRYPEVQDRVRAEILENIGPDRAPSMQDKKLLSYCQAVICEVQRMYPITPLGGIHYNYSDKPTKWKGYILPPNTSLSANVYGIHHDEDHWDEPFKFSPDRFIGSDGKFQKDDHLVTFSVGKRSCLGESLARMETFLFFVAIMQKFRVKKPDGDPIPTLEGKTGLLTTPHPHKVCFEKL